MGNSIIICAYPGIGKTTASIMGAYNSITGKKFEIIDFDSGIFKGTLTGEEMKKYWHSVYVEEALDLQRNFIDTKADAGNDQIIFLSSHREVRENLELREVPHIVLYPTPASKDLVIKGIVDRAKSSGTVGDMRAANFVETNWDSSIREMCQQTIFNITDERFCMDIRFGKYVPIPVNKGVYVTRFLHMLEVPSWKRSNPFTYCTNDDIGNVLNSALKF